jgi:hypothetical protein
MGGGASKEKETLEAKLKRLEKVLEEKYDTPEGISKAAFTSMFFLEDKELSSRIFSIVVSRARECCLPPQRSQSLIDVLPTYRAVEGDLSPDLCW